MELDGGKGWAVERSVKGMLEGTLSDTIWVWVRWMEKKPRTLILQAW